MQSNKPVCEKCGQPFPVRRFILAGDRIVPIYVTEEDNDYLDSLIHPKMFPELKENHE